MRFSPLAPIAATLVAATLAACGGSQGYTIAGTISGLVYPGLVLATNGDTVSPAANATTFAFGKQLSYGTTYNVVAQTQPQHQTCTIPNGIDSAGHLTSISIDVICSVNAYTIGGTVTGLTGAGLVLANGSSLALNTVAVDATTFTLPLAVPYNVSYGVYVLTQPTNQFCTVQNGTGVMGDAAVTNLVVACQNTGA